jgi:hypothetical protein
MVVLGRRPRLEKENRELLAESDCNPKGDDKPNKKVLRSRV